MNKIDVLEFSCDPEDQLFALHEELKSGLWEHGSYLSFTVHDPKPRRIHKATVRDRILHHAVTRVVEPLFERSFIFDSWSCRTGKGTHTAVQRLAQKLSLSERQKQGAWILKADIKKYFQNVDHDVLLKIIARQVHDEELMYLLEKIIRSFNPGIPLGNLTSQLFANVYLNRFDHYVKENLEIKNYLRYCDDFVMVSNQREDLECALKKAQKFLARHLKLTVHPDKIFFRPYHLGVDWLGYILYPGYTAMRPKTRKRMWNKINTKLNDYWSGHCNYEEFFSVCYSYLGALQPASGGGDYKKIEYLLKCL